VVLDLSGLTRLFGDARTIAAELRRTAADRGLRVRIAIAGTRTAARLLTRARAGITIVEPGAEARAIAALPIELLEMFSEPREPVIPDPRSPVPGPRSPISAPSNSITLTLRRWGLRTLDDLARLPADDIAARLGQDGVAWQRLARGEDPEPLVPSVPEERFEQALDLEWPIEGLEPLSFVLARLIEPLSAHLERRDRGAAVLHVRLHLVNRQLHERSLQLPAPMRDARTLRTLALLDLESHPPSAAIDRVVVAVDPTPGRVVQFSLLTRPLPSAESLSTLIARLSALMGEGRIGSPVVVDSWAPGAFEMAGFRPGPELGIRDSACPERSRGGFGIRDSTRSVQELACADPGSGSHDSGAVVRERPCGNAGFGIPAVAIRRFRYPVPARVSVDAGVPVRVSIDRRGFSGGRVEQCAGPWRTSGGWWMTAAATSRNGEGNPDPPKPRSGERGLGAPKRRSGEGGWDRDEWDVTLSDGATYRVYRDRATDAWFVDGTVD
jgi:protein ImuB